MSKLGTFWADIKNFFKKVLGEAPTVINDSMVAIAGISPLLETAIDAADPALGAELAPIITTTINGLKELQTLVTAYEKSPGTTTLTAAQAGIGTIQSNLIGILTAAKVKNTASAAKITTIVNSVATDLTVLESSLAAVMPATAPAPDTPAAAA